MQINGVLLQWVFQLKINAKERKKEKPPKQNKERKSKIENITPGNPKMECMLPNLPRND